MNKRIIRSITAIAAVVYSLGERCGLGRLFASGSPNRPPSNSATVQEYTAGLAVHGLPRAVRYALHVAWLPFALVIAAAVAVPLAGLAAVDRALVRHFPAFFAPKMLGVTLITPVMLQDVISAFRKLVPAISLFGAQWTAEKLKLGQKYTAHIAVYGSASTYDPVTGYANGANTARNGLVDVDVITDIQPTYPLKWLHLDGIKDDKFQYGRVMEGGGYVLGKSCIDLGFFAKMNTRYFSQEVVLAAADCDYDWLLKLGTAMNNQGCQGIGRVLFVNSAVAEVLGADPRMISKDYAGQLIDGNGYRQWRNVGGFALIQEYPDLPSNNGANLTGVTATASTDVLAKAAHGFVTGDPVVISVIGGGAAGLAINTRYWAIRVDANSFKLATSYANAIATTAIDITSDSSGGHLTLNLRENLIAFAADGRAFASKAGVPDGLTEMATQLGVVQTLTFDTPVADKDTGIAMTAAKFQEAGTGNLIWCPTFIYGTNAGKQAATAVAGNTAAANAVLAAANPAGTAADYAGLRCVSGAT